MNSKKTYTVEEAKRKLEQYCAYQERCHKDVKQKLYDMHMIPEAIDTIVVHLIEQKFLNEERFAKAYARGKFRIKKWGKNRIQKELKFREISAYSIKEALKEIDNDDYLNTLTDLILKQKESIKESNPYKKKNKIKNYLLYRGWESNLIYDQLNELL